MTEKEVFNMSVRIVEAMRKLAPGDMHQLLMDCLNLIQKQERDILCLEISLHDLAKEVDFGQ